MAKPHKQEVWWNAGGMLTQSKEVFHYHHDQHWHTDHGEAVADRLLARLRSLGQFEAEYRMTLFLGTPPSQAEDQNNFALDALYYASPEARIHEEYLPMEVSELDRRRHRFAYGIKAVSNQSPFDLNGEPGQRPITVYVIGTMLVPTLIAMGEFRYSSKLEVPTDSFLHDKINRLVSVFDARIRAWIYIIETLIPTVTAWQDKDTLHKAMKDYIRRNYTNRLDPRYGAQVNAAYADMTYREAMSWNEYLSSHPDNKKGIS